MRRLTETVVALRDQPPAALRKRLKQVLAGPLTQDFSPEQAKDFFYELELAADFKRAGFAVSLREPDIVISGNGLIVDNVTGELQGIGGLGFWWEEEVDTTRFVKLFLDGIKQAAGLSKAGMQVFELVYYAMRAKPSSDEIKLNL